MSKISKRLKKYEVNLKTQTNNKDEKNSENTHDMETDLTISVPIGVNSGKKTSSDISLSELVYFHSLLE